jgi:hypothetical protein
MISRLAARAALPPQQRLHDLVDPSEARDWIGCREKGSVMSRLSIISASHVVPNELSCR